MYNPMDKSKPNLGFWILFFALLLTSICLFGMSHMSFDWVKPRIDLLSTDGDAEKFTHEIFLSIVARLQISAGIMFFLSVIIFIFRHIFIDTLRKTFHAFWDDLGIFIKDLGVQLKLLVNGQDRYHLFALATFILLGLGLRLAFLTQPMRHDEAFTFTNYASKPLWVALSNYSFPNNHLFHTLCVHMSYLIFGNQLWAIRLPAFLSGLFLLPLSYVLVRKLYNQHVALTTTALIAVSSVLIEYGTNARGYALIGLIFIMILLLANYLRTKHNQAGWLFLSVLSAIGFYTVPVMLYPFTTIWVWLLLSAWQHDFSLPLKKTIIQLLAYGTLTVVLTSALYLPVIVASGLDAIINNRFVQPMTLSVFLNRLPERLTDVWTQWSRDYNILLTLVLVFSAGLAFYFHRNIAKHRICLAIPTVLSLAILLPTQGVLPPERVWLYILPIFLMIASAGLIGLLQNTFNVNVISKFAPALALALCLWSSVGAYQAMTTYYPYGPGTLKDAEDITEFLKFKFQQQDRLLTIATAAPLEYYFRKHEVPIDYLRESIANSNRLIVLVLEDKYTLDQVLQTAKVSMQNFTSPQLLRAYPSARLYEMNRQFTAQKTPDQKTGQPHDNRHGSLGH